MGGISSLYPVGIRYDRFLSGSGIRIPDPAERIPGYFSAGFSEGPLGSVAVNVPVSGTPIGPTGM